MSSNSPLFLSKITGFISDLFSHGTYNPASQIQHGPAAPGSRHSVIGFLARGASLARPLPACVIIASLAHCGGATLPSAARGTHLSRPGASGQCCICVTQARGHGTVTTQWSLVARGPGRRGGDVPSQIARIVTYDAECFIGCQVCFC